jgi:hypothetical protein
MRRAQRLRRAGAYAAAILGTYVQLADPAAARAADPETASPGPACPDSEAVWATVVLLVPSEAERLLAAKPRVEIVDAGDRYRVRVATDTGTLERTYDDPTRDCEKRKRFAAEFVVVSLLPPQLGVSPDATTSASSQLHGGWPAAAATIDLPGVPSGSTPAPPPATPSPATTAPVVKPPPPERTSESTKDSGSTRPPFLRIELSAIGEASPSVGAPASLAWGGDLRARLGRGAWSAVAGIGYLPNASFNVGDFSGNVNRVPAVAGVRAEVEKRYLHVDLDLALSAAFERYEGVSPHIPSAATRVTPGLELGVVASPHALFGLAPIAGVRAAWFPLTQELAAAPQGNLGSTPYLWIGAELGVSLELGGRTR